MLIGIDASRATVAQRTGTEGYSLHIIRGLIAQGGEHRFRLYFRDDPPAGLFPEQVSVETVIIRQPRFWTHRGLGPAVRRDPPDVLFIPAHVVPWPHVAKVPTVVTIHDVGYLRYPLMHPLGQRLYLDWATRHSARVAARVIAVSHTTADDLVALSGVPRDKVRVVHSGIDETFRPVHNLPEIVTARDRYAIPGPYLLHVGSIHSRKNPIRLVEAFAQVVQILPEPHLVFAGRPGWGFDRLKRRVETLQLSDKVVFPGFVAETDLPALYSGARAVALPSLYEGFGFPALEAMACGVPVVCSSTSSLPEIVGEAALTVDPESVASIAEALIRVLTDNSLDETLVEKGFEQAKRFSWESAARDTLGVLAEAVSI